MQTFAGLAIGSAEPGFPSPPYKIIILDEADNMTDEAQGALRRIMEAYSRVTRFVLVMVTLVFLPILLTLARDRSATMFRASSTQ